LVGDPDALAALARAGHEALRGGAPGTARRHLQAAVDLGEDQVSPGVLLDLSQALRATGDQEGAADVCEALLRRPGLSERIRLTALTELAQARFLLGRASEALARIDEAVRLTEADRPELGAVALVDHALFTVMHLGPRTALPLAERARELGVRAGGPASVLAQSAWGTCAYLSGDPAGLTASEAAAATWPLASHGALEVPHWSNPHQGYSNLATWAERYAQVEPELEARVGEAERRSDPVSLFQTLYALVELRCRRGRLHQALSICDHLLESAELVPYALPLALAGKALALLELGRLTDAAVWCGRLTEMASREGALGWAQGLDLHRRGILALRLGELDAATAVFSGLEQLVLEKGLEDPCIIPWPGGAVDAYLGAGREDDAVRVLDWLEPRAEALPARWPKVVLARGRAALAERHGDLAAAEQHLSSALVLHDRLDMPLAKAETLTSYGSFLSRHDDPARGRPLLGEALRLAEECDAGWHAERARAAWRRAGGRGGRTPAGSLTPQEATVARLARAGKTNREIADQLYLSVNTVETHLRHIYRKLGIERRWQLIASTETTSETASPTGSG
jgi:DNA-binding CsgD family transcriptional regulator